MKTMPTAPVPAKPQHPVRWRHAASGSAVALTMALASASAAAAGPIGLVGPVGPIGPTGPGQRVAAPKPALPPVEKPTRPVVPASAGNHIEVTGNSASGAGCNRSVNSVDVQGARLEGRTVIVQGRNTEGARAGADCPPPAPAASGVGGQVNSIRIR